MDQLSESSAWRDGKLLVLRRSSRVAPDRCIVTNEVIFGRSKISRQLSWGSDGPAAWIPTKLQILWSLADMKLITITFGLSGRIRAARYIVMGLSAAAIVVGATLFVEGLKKGVPPPMSFLGGGGALIVIALTLLANTYSVIDIVAMDENFVWLRGAKKPFLDSLPAFSKHVIPARDPRLS